MDKLLRFQLLIDGKLEAYFSVLSCSGSVLVARISATESEKQIVHSVLRAAVTEYSHRETYTLVRAPNSKTLLSRVKPTHFELPVAASGLAGTLLLLLVRLLQLYRSIILLHRILCCLFIAVVWNRNRSVHN